MLQVIQIGMSTSDMAGSLRLYSDVFGFSNSGGNCVWGDVIRSQGLNPDARALMHWMVGSQKFFQLEFFHHTSPKQRPLRADWKPNDHGWVRFGIAVEDPDRSRTALLEQGIALVGETHRGQPPHRFAFRDPYIGVIVEVMNHNLAGSKPGAISGRGPAVVYATSSVSNIKTAHAFYRDTLGFGIEPIEKLHDLNHEELWGLKGAQRDGFIARTGESSVLLEIVQYMTPPGRPRPADHRVSDQGIVNVALGSRVHDDAAAAFKNLARLGLKPPVLVKTKDVTFGYINDPERELEIAAFPEKLDIDVGFVALQPFMNRLIHSH